jgi:hypothetical protein
MEICKENAKFGPISRYKQSTQMLAVSSVEQV